MQAELDELLALWRTMSDEQKQELIKSADDLIKQQQNQASG